MLFDCSFQLCIYNTKLFGAFCDHIFLFLSRTSNSQVDGLLTLVLLECMKMILRAFQTTEHDHIHGPEWFHKVELQQHMELEFDVIFLAYHSFVAQWNTPPICHIWQWKPMGVYIEVMATVGSSPCRGVSFRKLAHFIT